MSDDLAALRLRRVRGTARYGVSENLFDWLKMIDSEQFLAIPGQFVDGHVDQSPIAAQLVVCTTNPRSQPADAAGELDSAGYVIVVQELRSPMSDPWLPRRRRCARTASWCARRNERRAPWWAACPTERR
jgi:hypothetical protein